MFNHPVRNIYLSMPRQEAWNHVRRIVHMYLDTRTVGDDVVVHKIINHIIDTGDCVWHAAHVITGHKCMCHSCRLSA